MSSSDHLIQRMKTLSTIGVCIAGSGNDLSLWVEGKDVGRGYLGIYCPATILTYTTFIFVGLA